MKILLNSDMLTPPLSGIGRYTSHLASGLEGHPEVSAVGYFSRNIISKRVSAPSVVRDLSNGFEQTPGNNSNSYFLWKRRSRKRFFLSGFRSTLRRLPFSYALRNKASEYLLTRTKYAKENYLYHETNYIPVPYQGPTVLTISDLSHLHYPKFHPPERVKWLKKKLKSSIIESKQIICYSQFIREELVQLLGVSPDKVNVVYLGVSDSFRPRAPAEVAPVLRKHGLDAGKYLLSVGTVEPRKNLLSLINAFSLLPQSVRRKYPLVIAGAKGWRTKGIEQVMMPLVQERSLLWLGYVTAEDLPMLYSGAHALAYPSLYEGFGFPVIEAMASGVPVLTSNRTSMPEIAGDACVLVEPEDADDIASGLKRLLLDDACHQKCAAAGLERAREFKWEKTVDKTMNVYRKALASV